MILSRERQGTVLIIVVVIVMLLGLVAYKYLLAMQTEHVATAMYGDRLRAKQSAESASDLLKLLLGMSPAERDAWGGLDDNPALFAGNTAALQGIVKTEVVKQVIDETPFGLVAYSRAPTPDTPSRASEMEKSEANYSSAFGQSGQFLPLTRYGAINESKKLHLWKLMQWEADSAGAGVTSLMALPGMDQPTAEALMDWLDPDDEPRDLGAESEFYATLTRPLAPRNGLPFELDELLFVKGVSTLRLYGTATALPRLAGQRVSTHLSSAFEQAPVDDSRKQTPWEATSSLGESGPLRPWSEMLTMYSAERNESYTGQRRAFVNGDDLRQLHEQLVARLSAQWADFIVLYRQFGPCDTVVSESANPTRVSVKIDFNTPAEVVIESLVDLIGASVTIPPEDEGEEATVVPSPAQTGTLAAVNLEHVFDQLTTIAQRRIIGRVNINQAAAEVLAAMPALNSEIAQRIVADRESKNETEQSHVHPIWLLTNDLVDKETMRALLPEITCGGDVYRAQIWGRAEEDAAMYRFETVLDASNHRCRSVYYRELNVSNREIKILSDIEFASLGVATQRPQGIGTQGPQDDGTDSRQRNEY